MQIVKGKQYHRIRAFADLREMLAQSLELYGGMPAFVFRDKPQLPVQTRTYRQFSDDMQSLGTALLAAGLGGARIAVIGDNSYAWCAAHLSILCGVGISVPLDRLLPEEELLNLLARSRTDAIFYDATFQAVMEKARKKCPGIRLFICMNPFKAPVPPDLFSPADGIEADALGGSRFILYDGLAARGRALLDAGDTAYADAPIDPEALACLLFTSGTTSSSKAVMLSHRNLCADVKALAGVVSFPVGLRMLSVLPLHHTFENTCGLLCAIYYGAVVHECDGLRYIQKNMEEYRIHCLIGVPLLFESFYAKIRETVRKQGKEKLLKRAIRISGMFRRVGIDLRRKLFKDILGKFGGEFNTGICGAAPIDPEIIRFFDAVGVRILQGYGLTETSPVVAGCNDRVFVPGTVGHPLAGTEIAIDCERDGDDGEILVRGGMVMMGYYGDEAATREAIDGEGWLRTGDIGHFGRRDGCLHITGRQKSMIVLKNGKKVFPEEIEYLLGQIEYVKESMVWGEAEADGDVDVWARIVLDREVLDSQGSDIADEHAMRRKIEDMIREINLKVPSFKSIRYFIFGEEEMEKTTTKKIRRNAALESVRAVLEKNRLKIGEAAGKNIDALRNLLHHDKDGGQSPKQ